MDVLLEEFMTTMALAFMLTFVRLGAAIMIMPGVGDSFAPNSIRLHMAVGITLAFFPMTMQYMPATIPPTFTLLTLIIMEFIIGLFFGTIARIFMVALDTAGMVISTSSGLGNAQVFNPAMATQGSLVGAFLSVTGVVVLFSANFHHLLFTGLIESYEMFPIGSMADTGSMAELMSKAVASSFSIGLKIGAPFVVLTLLIYVGMGVLSRLMPQLQVFLLALPLQILIAVTLLAMLVPSIYLFWGAEFENAMLFFLSPQQ